MCDERGSVLLSLFVSLFLSCLLAFFIYFLLPFVLSFFYSLILLQTFALLLFDIKEGLYTFPSVGFIHSKQFILLRITVEPELILGTLGTGREYTFNMSDSQRELGSKRSSALIRNPNIQITIQIKVFNQDLVGREDRKSHFKQIRGS